ncbi:cellulase family glycosylhydrolase [Paenibacillus thiaminolyticus]|uniref:Cellulase family glycosylhydrolase n=1 Tax=Paenibacillus thiaminolyticus TaxID=49283 RepID=A0AAP9DV70_PANTH|nr:cellulase family glycosylhydrolase [Paenibacillus thiaminolyticus]MCY9538426.1 cellulase family glycosylhydrolase [Paenibacillus thiaminolyticus]MCY9604339.1 cellulase family glycosylhydrolase [Paenibacillus thiaminolyticus]MCY9609563.1 cellulase family glycosylhydrolase [Paenibacillus thiaminolyticus]MCY9616045.1 cellulase family glycosylhydrolase [Paenibacillus thiaminolyticus]MCY9621436.1 cellulase family glycosylhydrolase [Paenibacillus thiaminolyticus]
MCNILIFSDDAFPGYRPVPIDLPHAVSCSAQELRHHLTESFDVFVNMHGAYFPMDAFETIERFLEQGNGFLHFGDVPFQYPVIWNGTGWDVQKQQWSYLRKLNIHSFMNVGAEECGIAAYEVNRMNPVADSLMPLLEVQDTRNLIMVPTKNKYVPKEWGSVGSMDAAISPLVKGLTQDGEHYSSPVVLIENRAGKYRGGRWIWVNQEISTEDRNSFAQAVTDLGAFAARGVREIFIKPSFASYLPGEKASVTIQIENPAMDGAWHCHLELIHAGDIIASADREVSGSSFTLTDQVPFDCELKPGHYEILMSATSQDGERRQFKQGFWVRDDQLLSSSERVKCGTDYFIINGKPAPVVGTTYMSSDYSRAFLQYPNPGIWMDDMRDMKQQGINWIRTGMWCNWRRFMLDDGHFDEFILRSIDAFIQCAAAHGLQVTFTFFTFVPEPWEGSHPYLDIRSLEAQKRFIAHIVGRHQHTTNVDWDLINEPYVSDHPSQRRSDDDVLERNAFQAYMREKYQSVETMAAALDIPISDVPDFSALPLPERQHINFDITDMGDSKNGLIWQDYLQFCTHMFRQWTEEMKAVITAVQPLQLVTVGQDEALRGQRPTPLLIGDLLDYNAQHTWWLLDDLVWDTVFTKYYGKPLLVQETGIMYLENADNSPRRTEREIADLLEKKFAYAFATRCAGVIQWVWNTNCYLQSANESNIGAIRSDGSKKPEMKVSRQFAEFFAQSQDYISDMAKQEEIAVIFPFTNDFSNKNFAQQATAQIIKVLAYYNKQLAMGVSEYELEPLLEAQPKLIFLPSPHHIDGKQFEKLMALVREMETTLVITGPISLNEYFAKTNRAQGLVGDTSLEPLSRFERLTYADKSYELSFAHHNAGRAFKENGANGEAAVNIPLGKGRLIWIPLPIELAEEPHVLKEIYADLIREAQVTEPFQLEGDSCGIFVSRLNWQDGILYTIINETGADQTLRIRDHVLNQTYSLTVGSNRSSLFTLDKDGTVIASYKNDSIIQAK